MSLVIFCSKDSMELIKYIEVFQIHVGTLRKVAGGICNANPDNWG